MAGIFIETGTHHRIEKIRAGVVEERDRADRIAARAHRPHDVFEVHDIDIVVDDDNVTRRMRRLKELRSDDRRLARLTVIGLLETDQGQQICRARLRPIHAGDAADSGALEQFPKIGRFDDRMAVGAVVRRPPATRLK